MTRFALLATVPIALVACATVGPEEQPQVAGGDGECRNEPLAQFAGRQATQELGAQILRASGARVLQWINPGEMVTMDFRPNRVRVTLDAQGRVEGARCG